MPAPYLAHEYMNDSLAPCFHADVAGALAEAKLEWVGSANLIENFPELTLTPEQRAVTQRFDDPLLRELVKDMCLDRSLRHDVFVRGARRMNPAARDAALMDVWLALNISPTEMPYEADMPAGRAALNRSLLRTDHRGDGDRAAPCRRSAGTARPRGQARQSGRADRHPGRSRSGRAGRAAGRRTDAAGAALQPRHPANLSRTENLGRPIGAASYALGTGAPCTLFDLYVIERMQAGEGEAEHRGLGARTSAATSMTRAAATCARCSTKALHVRLPILRAQGVF